MDKETEEALFSWYKRWLNNDTANSFARANSLVRRYPNFPARLAKELKAKGYNL
jgi:hypothetical protein